MTSKDGPAVVVFDGTRCDFSDSLDAFEAQHNRKPLVHIPLAMEQDWRSRHYLTGDDRPESLLGAAIQWDAEHFHLS